MSNSLFIATNGYLFWPYFFSSTNHLSRREFKLSAIQTFLSVLLSMAFELSMKFPGHCKINKQQFFFTVSVNSNHKSQKEEADFLLLSNPEATHCHMFPPMQTFPLLHQIIYLNLRNGEKHVQYTRMLGHISISKEQQVNTIRRHKYHI